MSKMRIPEMSVVRFTESDVIVASLTVRFDNYRDATPKNGMITIGGVQYTCENENRDSYTVDIFTQYGLPSNPNVALSIESPNDNQTNLSTMMTNDSSGSTTYVTNGTYQWDPIYNIFKYKGQ